MWSRFFHKHSKKAVFYLVVSLHPYCPVMTCCNYCNSFLAGFANWHYYCWQLQCLLTPLSNHAALGLLFIHFFGGLQCCINFQMSQLIFELLPIMGVATSNVLFEVHFMHISVYIPPTVGVTNMSMF